MAQPHRITPTLRGSTRLCDQQSRQCANGRRRGGVDERQGIREQTLARRRERKTKTRTGVGAEASTKNNQERAKDKDTPQYLRKLQNPVITTPMPLQPASPATCGFDAARLTRIDDWMRRYVDDGKFPFAAALIARKGALAWTGHYGLSDVAAALPTRRRLWCASTP